MLNNSKMSTCKDSRQARCGTLKFGVFELKRPRKDAPYRICPGDQTPPRSIHSLNSRDLKLSFGDVMWHRHGPEDKKEERPREGRSL